VTGGASGIEKESPPHVLQNIVRTPIKAVRRFDASQACPTCNALSERRARCAVVDSVRLPAIGFPCDGVKEVQAHLRHSRATTTLDVYIQEIPDAVRSAVERLDAMLTTPPRNEEEGKEEDS